MSTEPEKRPEFKDLEAALAGTGEALSAFVDEAHPADLANWLVTLDDANATRVFEQLDDDQRRELLSFADKPVRARLLAGMSVEQIVRVVEELPADDVVDLLALTNEATTEQVLRTVNFARAQGLRQLASYDAESAGGLMTTEYVNVPEDANVGDAIKLIKSEEGPASDEDVGVFVVDSDGKPTGYVSDRDLLTTGIHTPIRDVMDTDVITVPADADQEEVAHLFLKYSLSALPVVDDEGALLGVIAADDAQEVLHEEAEEDIRRIVGTSTSDQSHVPVLVRVRQRLPLQALTVLGGLTTAHILNLALRDDSPGEHGSGDVLRYLPIIIGLAGNVGIQSSTILVRAFATGEVSQDRERSVVASEVFVGLLIGLICGTTTTGVATWMEGGNMTALRFALGLGFAILVAVTWAAFLGCQMPILCRRLGIDPAIAAGPFMITLSDVSGAAIFVAITHFVLTHG